MLSAVPKPKREHKPLNPSNGKRIASLFVTFGPGLPQFLSRTEVWAYYDRRRAIALDVADQVGDIEQEPAMLAVAITLTDAECEEVERYAALPFPRSVDMPQPLRRLLGVAP